MSARLLKRHGATVVTLALLAVVGTTVMVYILLHQRFPNPLVKTYEITVVLPSADGVTPGSGQPVKVSGVPVGVISGLRLENGRALVTLRIRRDELSAVHRDATATLRPISPLKDMQILLDPGSATSGKLPDGGRIPIARNVSPVDLDVLTSGLDADTRSFLTTLIDGVGAGLDGQGPSLRRTLRAFAPTVGQAHALAHALAGRRRELARLVSNLGVVADAAADDGRLAGLVSAGNATLGAIAAQERPLRTAMQRLPGTLAATARLLPSLKTFAGELTPAIDSLQPAVRRLPRALRAAGSFSRRGAPVLQQQLRPFVRAVTPVVSDLAAGTHDLTATAPALDAIVRAFTYLVDEAAYNPPGDDEGMLFWLDWAGHNIVSTTSTADANGAMVRATVFVSCALVQGLPGLGAVLADALGATPVCKAGTG